MSWPRILICVLPLIGLMLNSAMVAKGAIYLWRVNVVAMSAGAKGKFIMNQNRSNTTIAVSNSNSSGGGLHDATFSSAATTEGPPPRISTYLTEAIARTVNALEYAPGRLLIYNPINDTIHVYAISNARQPPLAEYCNACHVIVPMLARALWKNQRLAPHQQPLQIFFSDADFTYVDMRSLQTTSNETGTESPEFFSPWLQFGSVFRDATILPTVQAFPFPDYLVCLDELLVHQSQQQPNASSFPDQICTTWKVPFRSDLSWDNLTRQMIWRGSDFTFLHTFRQEDFRSPHSVSAFPFFPRRHIVNMSDHGETWIDASIPSGAARTSLSRAQLSEYKYHIDLAGAGGTTWTGTLEKLAMPGLLFHHDTPALDWYHDTLKAWYHYVPVRTDLSDLQERYRWAEEHQDEARAIAERGTEFARSFFSYDNLQREHERYFGENGVLTKVVDAYENYNMSVDSLVKSYQELWNQTLLQVSVCTREYCDVKKTWRARGRTSIQPGSCLRISRDLGNFGRNMDRCIP